MAAHVMYTDRQAQGVFLIADWIALGPKAPELAHECKGIDNAANSTQPVIGLRNV